MPAIMDDHPRDDARTYLRVTHVQECCTLAEKRDISNGCTAAKQEGTINQFEVPLNLTPYGRINL